MNSSFCLPLCLFSQDKELLMNSLFCLPLCLFSQDKELPMNSLFCLPLCLLSQDKELPMNSAAYRIISAQSDLVMRTYALATAMRQNASVVQ